MVLNDLYMLNQILGRRTFLLHPSEFPLVCTSGVWTVRNFPPQVFIRVKPFYYMISITILFFFVKDFFVSQQSVPFFLIDFHKRDNRILIFRIIF